MESHHSIDVLEIARPAIAALLIFLGLGCQGGAGANRQRPSAGIFVANYCSSSITRYPIDTNGDVPPSNRGPGLCLPEYLAIDPTSGRIVVANGNNIEIFSPHSRGYAHPVAIIAGPRTGLADGGLTGVAVDASGNIYVARGAESYDNRITEFAAGSQGDVAPVSVITLSNNIEAPSPLGLAVDSNGNIYAANFGAQSVTEFAAGSNGNAVPIAMIRAGLQAPSGIAVRAGKIFVSDFTDKILVYEAGSNGAEEPIAVINGPSTGLSQPADLDVDAAGNIFVSNFGNNTITEYRAASTGDATPIATIGGAETGLNEPRGLKLDKHGDILSLNLNWGSSRLNTYVKDARGDIAPRSMVGAGINRLAGPTSITFDPDGNLYVASFDPASVAEFAAASEATVAPIRLIAGPHTGLSEVSAIAVDKVGGIYATNVSATDGSASIVRFGPKSNGDVAPDSRISGSNTKLDYPDGIALDGSGNIFVANDAANSITVYPPGDSGNTTPIATISGTSTGLFEPGSIAFDAAGNLYVANLGAGQSVTVYPPKGRGNISPSRTIFVTGVVSGLAVDADGDVFVVDDIMENVREYSPKSGDLPIKVIQGLHTQLSLPSAVAIRR